MAGELPVAMSKDTVWCRPISRYACQSTDIGGRKCVLSALQIPKPGLSRTIDEPAQQLVASVLGIARSETEAPTDHLDCDLEYSEKRPAQAWSLSPAMIGVLP